MCPLIWRIHIEYILYLQTPIKKKHTHTHTAQVKCNFNGDVSQEYVQQLKVHDLGIRINILNINYIWYTYAYEQFHKFDVQQQEKNKLHYYTLLA